MKKFYFIVLFTLVSLFVSAQTIEKVYHFEAPEVTEIQAYSQIQFKDCMQTAKAGDPSLPYKSVSLLLPYGSEAVSVEVELSDFEEIALERQLFPYQPSRPYSMPERKSFIKNEDVYSSKGVYPIENHGIVTTHYMNGHAFAFTSFTPVQYEPSNGKVMYAKTAKVKVEIASSREDHSAMIWNTPYINSRVMALADNPEMITSYKMRGREISTYDMLIITGSDYVAGFDEYINYYDSIGVSNRIVTVDEIYDEVEGIDNQDKIRNYIIQEYTDNGILMVLLGGDVNIVPYRGFYCTVLTGGDYEIDYGIPADLYFCALDGNWNDNNDNKWGEIGEDDLLPEIGIARMSFNNETKQANMINKTLKYQRSPVLGEFRDVTLAGEWLYDNPETYGSDYLELLIGEHDDNGYTTIGIPEDYNFTRLYAEENGWSGSALMSTINAGTQYVHHVGHANTDFVADWYNSSITDENFSGANGVDHNYTFFHSHGCICGSFEDDCIMERMISIQNFAVAAIGNSRYGWFNEGQTEGPSGHLHREMTDAQYHERIPFLGLTLTESKIQTAPFVNAPGQWEEGALRWNFYDLNILGDVAVRPWLDEPFDPSIEYEEQMVLGIQSTDIEVRDEDNNGRKGFRCSIYNEDGELIGFAITNDEGVATIEFDGGLTTVGEMKLVVTGLDAFPQVLDVTAVPNNSAYIVYDNFILNDEDGQIDYSETQLIDMIVKNVGSVNAENVTATLSCDKPDYVNITNSTVEIGSVSANSDITLEDAFEFVVCDSVPNNTKVRFFLTCTDGTDVWESKFNTTIYAPEFEIVNYVIEDEDANGDVDPGETVTVHFTIANTGNSAVENATFAVFCSADEISFDQNEFTIESLIAGEEIVMDFTFTLSENAEQGVAYEMILAVYFEKYITYDSFTFAVGSVVEDFETGDLSKYDWQLSGSPTWSVVTEDPYEGNYCIKSGAVDDYNSTTLQITLNVFSETEISFYKKVSSESSYDKLKFTVDGTDMGNWSGEIAWSQETFTLTVGEHILEWTYTKDMSVSNGSDCAWLDNIVFPPTTIIESVEYIVAENISIYPNPSEGLFNVELGDEEYEVTIYNTMGQIVYHVEAASGKLEVSLNDISAGLYFVNIKNTGNNISRKIVIE
ncbi:MAG: T9SS type A sorting domain-containing protein [Lentimicrobiaceae bacterium]|nr:T9SS type A sorting domain-containing protein [Lentimicrobiaceae bacterium]